MNTKKRKIPFIPGFLLKAVSNLSIKEGYLGDIEEEYFYIRESSNKFKAVIWIWLQAVKSIPGALFFMIQNSISMFKNYMKIGFRSIKRQKFYSIINLSGMALGMALFMIFSLSAGSKLNSDRFHKNADRMFGVIQVLEKENKEKIHTTATPLPLLDALKRGFPEIEKGVRFFPSGKFAASYEDENFYEYWGMFADPNFLEFFTFEMVSGSAESAISDPFSVVISERTAAKYFGEENPLGKIIRIDNKVNVTITGVLKDISRASSIKFDFLFSMEVAKLISGIKDDWKDCRTATFLQLSDNYDKTQFDNRLTALIKTHYGNNEEAPSRIYLIPFLNFRLGASHVETFLPNSKPVFLFIGLSFGIILLLVVCINFINMTISRYMYRLNEIGLRKVIGARRSQLIKQFLGESILLAFLAIPLAIICYEIFHPVIAALLEKSIGMSAELGFHSSVSNSILNYPFLLKYLVIAALLSGLFSGFYPAFFLSTFQPVNMLKGKVLKGKKGGKGRKFLVILQFTISILFIILADTLTHQGDNFINADLGYNRDNVGIIRLSKESRKNLNLIKNELARRSEVISISASMDLPGVWEVPSEVTPEGSSKEEALTMHMYGIEYDFLKVLDMKMHSGRSFSKAGGDRDNFIINESALKKLPWEDPLGKQLTVNDRTGTIIGISEDFLFADIGFDIPPAVLYIEPENLQYLLIKLAPNIEFPEFRTYLKNQWAGFAQGEPLEFYSLDEHMFKFLDIIKIICGFLSLIGYCAMFFAGLGLIGLASCMVERRTKEIGIRKALGASILRLNWILIKEFLFLVAIANIIALPVIYYAWHRIMQMGLLFITNLNTGNVIFVVAVSLFATIVAVSSQTIKAAVANPVDTLRYE